jgi:hypothetical protein
MDLWETVSSVYVKVPLRPPNSCSRISVLISPRLWFCGRSEIESKSSRFQCISPRCLVTSNLGRYKASYLHCFSSSTLVRTTHGFVPITAKLRSPSYAWGASTLTHIIPSLYMWTLRRRCCNCCCADQLRRCGGCCRDDHKEKTIVIDYFLYTNARLH